MNFLWNWQIEKNRFFQNGKIIGKSLQIQDALTDKSDKAIWKICKETRRMAEVWRGILHKILIEWIYTHLILQKKIKLATSQMRVLSKNKEPRKADALREHSIVKMRQQKSEAKAA